MSAHIVFAAKAAITTNPGEHIAMGAAGLSPAAPNWAKELFAEMTQKMGLSAEDALRALARSPFFKEEWVVK